MKRVIQYNQGLIRRPWQPAGSSPRMRGTRPDRKDPGHRERFIPAHAGNTGRSPGRRPGHPVHPRACGEHARDVDGFQPWSGSSPRMRGTPGPRRSSSPLGRFIPAHAGNTYHPAPFPDREPVHPRACGEHLVWTGSKRSLPGSSPRMRGTLVLEMEYKDVIRFIPAHAGNTGLSPGCSWPWPVHPRACGEHHLFQVWHDYPPGSSPRMRGTLIGDDELLVGDRFIPAHAGNTSSGLRKESRSAVHPRACGEHSF